MRRLAPALLLVLSARAAATDMPPPQPPPPSKPVFSDPYFKLAWTWNGSGFSIASAGVAKAPSGTTTYTGSVLVIESWVVRTVGGAPKWVEVGDSGMVTKGSVTDGKSGYARYHLAESTETSVPTSAVVMRTRSLDSESLPVNGVTNDAGEETQTWYAPDGTATIKSGWVESSQTTRAAKSDSSTKQRTTFDGNPAATDFEKWTSSTGYADGAKTLISVDKDTYDRVLTSVYTSGKTESTITESDKSTLTNWPITVNGRTAMALMALARSTTSTRTLFDSTGTQWQSDSYTRVVNDANTVLKDRSLPKTHASFYQHTSAPEVGPPYQDTFSRATSWDMSGKPGGFTCDARMGEIDDHLYLHWTDAGLLDSIQIDPGLEMVPGFAIGTGAATTLYDFLHDLEMKAMAAPAPDGDYPFWPAIQAVVPPTGFG